MMTNLTMLVRNRPRLTKQALASLNGTIGNLTILDDRSDAETRELLDKASQNMHVVHNEIAMGTGELRNAVIKASEQKFGRGDYLYLSDNDVCFREPGWLDTLIRVYEFAWKHGFRVLGAYNHPYHLPIETIYTPDAYAVHSVHALALQSMLMRWSVWDEFGPFCQTPPDAVCQGEDGEFSARIRAAGFKLGTITPALIVNCGITNSFGVHIPGWEHVAAVAPGGVIIE